MSIPEAYKKINILILVAICLVFGFMLAFGSLKLHAFVGKKEPVTIVIPEVSQMKGTEPVIPVESQKVVASKTGTKYHLLDCSGAKTIAEKNKVFFANPAAAERAGYAPASTCKALSPK